MKRLLAIILLALPALCPAQTAPELYDRGDYLGAAAAYGALIEQSPGPNPYLYYNLANSYFKAGDSDKAVVNYYRAFRLLPRGREIKNNLAFALNSAGQRLAPEGVPQAAFDLYYFFSGAELKGLTWLFVWLFAFSFALLVFTRKKDFAKKAAAVCLAGAFIFGLWHALRCGADNAALAVTTAARAEVRSGPGAAFPVGLSVPRAHILVVSDNKDDWAEVSIPGQNTTGWVLKQSIEEI
ncbi:MAG: tetratricopeptide repeat protein [Elusimicrobiota bacterium]|jgi:tetratricopeptide (TPR) repeat protein|nr:tetratricopeptide repeat protein [Elusimicrobiota bacterium]